MGKYILKRLLWMIPVVLGVLLIVFFISYITPGDPVKIILGSNYTEEAYITKTQELGLDKPFLTQYVQYVVNMVTKGSMGTSYTYGHSVAEQIVSRMGITLKIGLLGVMLTVIVGVPIGVLSATKQYSVLDYSVTTLSTLFAAMPNFWLALLCILLFSLKLGWLPATGFGSWKQLVLPVVTNALTSVAVVARMARSSMLEVIRQDYIRTARAKGLREGAVIRRHALKNSLIPVLTVVGMQMSMVMGGSVIIETIFSIPGLGAYMMAGINARDYPVINGTVVVLSLSICLMNLLVDIAYAYVDPRIRSQYTRKKAKAPKTPAAVQSGGEQA
ncbi:MAG: ABC transporter permease [Oscillospiraceae bacterium]